MALPSQDLWTEAEYLAFEQESAEKHEFADGKIIAMTGASWVHNLICVNTSTTLNVQLADTECHVTSNDLRLKVDSKHHYRYPDVMVICGTPEFVLKRNDTITNPVVVIEILSESTALIDRNDKLDEYTRIESVQAYVMISQTEAKIERYLRQADSADWLYTRVSGLESVLEIPPIHCTLKLSEIYNKVELEK
ncbi:MAG: Uma2 family endonuclease [Aggregatilineales bacterium]